MYYICTTEPDVNIIAVYSTAHTPTEVEWVRRVCVVTRQACRQALLNKAGGVLRTFGGLRKQR